MGHRVGAKLNAYEQTLLVGWEEVHKKSQLSLWILLALKSKQRHMAEIKSFIVSSTNGTLEADDQSMYRALRRFGDAELISFTTKPSKSGPELKVYQLTPSGKKVLKAFLERHITAIFYQPKIQKLISKV